MTALSRVGEIVRASDPDRFFTALFAPLVITQFTPNQQLSPIRVGPFDVKPCQVTGMLGSS